MQRIGDILYNIYDRYTGELITYSKTNTYADGTSMDVTKCDGVIYRMLDSGEFFKRDYQGVADIKWFGAKGDRIVNDTSTIQKAVDTMGNMGGGGLHLSEGDYKLTTAIVISKPNIKITGANNSILRATGPGQNTININADNVSVDGISFWGSALKSGNSYTAAIVASGVNGVDVSNCTFTDISGGAVYLSWSLIAGVYTGCSYCSVRNNIIINCVNQDEAGEHPDAAAIRIGYSQTGYFSNHNVIDNNYIDNQFKSDFGIAMEGHGFGNRFTNNTVTNCVAYGIMLYETAYGQGTEALVYKNVVDGNVISNIGYQDSLLPVELRFKGMGIYLQKSHWTVVSNNTISNACINPGQEILAQGAIGIGGSCGCVISDNSIITSNRDGIYASLSFNVTITGNSIQNSTRHGVKLQDSSNLIFSNNTIKDSNDNAIRATFSGLSPDYELYYTNMGQINNPSTGESINITNNTIYRFATSTNATVSITGNAASGERPDNPVIGLLFTNNTIKTNRTALSIIYTKNAIVSGNSIKVYLVASSGVLGTANCDNIKFIGNDIQGLPTDGANITNGILYSGTNGVFLANKVQGATNIITMASDQYQDNRKTMFKQNPPASGDFVIGDSIINTNPLITGVSPNRQYIKGWTYTPDGWVAQKAYESNPSLQNVISVSGVSTLPITLSGQTYRSDGNTDTGIALYTNNVIRWLLAKYHSGTEGGGNTGSGLQLVRYDDAGSVIDIPFYLDRTTGYLALGSNNTSPAEKLDISGNIKLSGAITMAAATILSGSGNPESVVSASPGSLFLSSAGTAYLKKTGTSNTGWGLITVA